MILIRHFFTLLVLFVSTFQCKGSDCEALSIACDYVKKCLHQHVMLAKESERLRNVKKESPEKVTSTTERVACSAYLYESVCRPHMDFIFNFLKDPPGGTKAVEKCCGIRFYQDVANILVELPVAGK